MPCQAFPREAVDLPEGAPAVAQPEVVGPPVEVAVEPHDQVGQWRMTLLPVDHPAQFLALARQRLLGGMEVPVASVAPLQIAVEAEAEAEEVEGLPRFAQVHHPRLFPVDLQPHPALDFLFHEALELFACRAGE